MEIEELNHSLEYFGIFQVIMTAMIFLSWSYGGGMHVGSNVFITAKQKYHCSDEISRDTTSNLSLSNYHFNNATNFSTNLYQSQLDSCGSNQCSNWSFSTEDFISTMRSDFNLVCEREILAPLSISLYFAGNAVGSPLFGCISDRFGRIRACAFGLLLSISISAVCVWREILNVHMYLIGRFLLGLTLGWSQVSEHDS